MGHSCECRGTCSHFGICLLDRRSTFLATAVSAVGGIVEGMAAMADVGTGAGVSEEGVAHKLGAEKCILGVSAFEALVAIYVAIFVCVRVLWVVLVKGIAEWCGFEVLGMPVKTCKECFFRSPMRVYGRFQLGLGDK